MLVYVGILAYITILTAYIQDDILAEAEAGYGRINELLRQVDGATNKQLFEAMECNLSKTRAVSNILGKLLAFIKNTSQEFETEDAKMAGNISVGEGSGQ